MASETKPQIKKPTGMDLAKGQKTVDGVIRKNKKWLKEMAAK
jgi:hypothetical protein